MAYIEIIGKFFRERDKKVSRNLLIGLAIGVTLLVVSQTFLKPKPADDTSAGVQKAETTAADGGQTDGGLDSLERRMEEILSLVDGAGKVRVLINYSQSAESVVAKNVTADASETAETDSTGGERRQSQSKNQESVVTLRQKDGNEEPLVLYEAAPKIEGVIIVAEGGGDVVVRDALIRAASGLLGVAIHKVSVLKMGS